MTAFLVVAAVWLLPSALIGAWILADRWLDARHSQDEDLAFDELLNSEDPFERSVAEAVDLANEGRGGHRSETPIFDECVDLEVDRLRANLDDTAQTHRWLDGLR